MKIFLIAKRYSLLTNNYTSDTGLILKTGQKFQSFLYRSNLLRIIHLYGQLI